MFVTLMPCLYVLLCGPKIRNKDSYILYTTQDFYKLEHDTALNIVDVRSIAMHQKITRGQFRSGAARLFLLKQQQKQNKKKKKKTINNKS